MSYRKSVRGDANQANETGINHNRITIETGASMTIFAVFAVILVTGAILYIALAYREILQYGTLITITLIFIVGWVILIGFTRRSISKTTTVLTIDRIAQNKATLEARIVAQAENYVLYQDTDGSLQFRGTVQVTENRHFPAIEAPKEVDQSQGILQTWDLGLSGRDIEKLFKEKGVSYRQIQDTLNTYRPGWNKKGKGKIENEKYVDADEEIPL